MRFLMIQVFALSVCLPSALAQQVPTGTSADATESNFDLFVSIADGPPLSVEEAVLRAVQGSPGLRQSRALAEAAEAGVARSRTQMLPRLDLTASYVHIDGFEDGVITLGADPAALEAQQRLASMVTDPAAQLLWTAQTSNTGGVSIPVPRNRYNVGARLSWPVSDFFFALLPAAEASEHRARARVHELAVTEAGVRRSAHESYLNLVRARGAHGVAVQAQRQAQARVDEVMAAVRAGFLTPADQLGAESRAAQALHAVELAWAGVEIADAGLRTIIGADDGEVFGVSLGEARTVQVDFAGAVERRAELRGLREMLSSQRSTERTVNAGGYPHLVLFAGADVGNPSRYQVPPIAQWTPSWEVGASLTWSPNDTLSASDESERLAAEQVATEAQIENMTRMIRLQVRQAQARFRAAERGIQAAELALRAAEAAYESRLSQLRAGNTTTAAVFDNERQLNQARLALLDVRVQFQLARVHLAFASGQL